MTRLRSTIAVIALAAALALPCSAAAKEKLTASPTTVAFGKTLTLRGTGWPVIEFCKRQVTLLLKTSQNSFRIGTVRTRTSGRFTFRWVPRRARVGAGKLARGCTDALRERQRRFARDQARDRAHPHHGLNACAPRAERLHSTSTCRT